MSTRTNRHAWTVSVALVAGWVAITVGVELFASLIGRIIT